MQSLCASLGFCLAYLALPSSGLSAGEFLHRGRLPSASPSGFSQRRQNPFPGADATAAEGLAKQDRLLEEGVGVLELGRQFLYVDGAKSSSLFDLQNIQWLHIPKAGTSFISTIWGYACGRGDLPLDLNVDPKAAPDCLSCYDFALMDRYPKDMFCAEGVLHPSFQTQHKPMTGADMDEGVSAIGLFRKPAQRLISAYIDGYHTQGFSEQSYVALRNQCDGQTVACFARFPGVAGCSTRMLTGKRCAEDPADYPGGMPSPVELVPEALKALNKMKFVGITEEWDESVCLFHLMFGGVLYSDEFHDVHQGPRDRSNVWDEQELAGFVDEADEAIYQAALLRFRSLRRMYAGGDSACARITGAGSYAGGESFLRVNGDLMHSGNISSTMFEAAGASSGNSLLHAGNLTGTMPEAAGASSRIAASYSRAVDYRADCQSAGVQCGPWLNQRHCGVCPAMRLRFMSEYYSLTNLEMPSHRPVCSADGVCVSNGQPVAELFGWTYQAR